MKKLAARADFDITISDLHHSRSAPKDPSSLLGKRFGIWLEYAKELAKDGGPQSDKALEIVYALITLAEYEAVSDHRPTDFIYTERAAILHRRRKEYAGEVAVLERWESAYRPKNHKPDLVSAKAAKRLRKAREFAAKQAQNEHT